MNENNYGIGKRAIKFRVAWNGIVSINSFNIGEFWEREVELEFANGETLPFGDIDWENDTVQYLQYTGLLDKHGKEIYEGDIMSFHYGVVNFEDGGFGIEYKDRFNEASSCELVFQNKEHEVIGNVFENESLLK